MPISVTCPACQNTLKVKDEYAGKKGKCPKCQTLMTIPALAAAGAPTASAPAQAAAAARAPVKEAPRPAPAAAKAPPAKEPDQPTAPAAKSRDEIRQEILAAFTGSIEVPRAGFGRKLGTVFVLIILFVLPLFYLVVLGGIAGGLVWLWMGGAGQTLSPALFWLAMVGGVFVLLCLLKPLLEPRRRAVQGYPLAKEKEKLFTELVGKVCDLIDAPAPNAIVLECSTQLAAGYRGGIFGLLRRDVVLMVGLPLLVSLSVEQFAGLVAGRMAQYRRRAGCRATNMIRGINGWLWRSIYDNGRFDEWLVRVTSRPGLNAGKLLLPLRGIKLIAQAVLWIPMFIGNTVASGVVRRTELEGDLCHARLVGSEAFAAVLPRLKISDYTWQGIVAELAFRHRDQSLPDNLPKQMQLQMVDMTPELCAILLETAVKPEEKPFDSRPPDADRLAAIAGVSKTGVFRCDSGAGTLLADDAALGKTMTWDYYVSLFGSQLLRTALKKI